MGNLGVGQKAEWRRWGAPARPQNSAASAPPEGRFGWNPSQKMCAPRSGDFPRPPCPFLAFFSLSISEGIESCSSAPSGRLGEQALGWGKRRGADLGPGGAAAGPKGLAGDGPAPPGAPTWQRAATLARPSWARSRGAGQLGFTQG